MTGEKCFERIVEVHCHDDYWDAVDRARVLLSKTDLTRIAEMAETIRAKDFSVIRVWYYGIEYGSVDEESGSFVATNDKPGESISGFGFRTECDEMEVSKCGDIVEVRWLAYLKHTNVRLETEGLDVADLLKAA